MDDARTAPPLPRCVRDGLVLPCMCLCEVCVCCWGGGVGGWGEMEGEAGS